jgi:hypothetical protein
MKTFTGLHTFSAAYGCIKSVRGLHKRKGCDKTLEPVVGITITPQAG